MERQELIVLYKKYDLSESDVYKHKHYTIITRQGIDKIQAKENIFIEYEAIRCEPEFCAVKATAKKDAATIQTFGSAKYGGKEWNKDRNNGKGGWDESGNTTTWYVMEMAEKRAMSRAVLKLTGFYELGVFGEDENEDFKRKAEPEQTPKKEESKQPKKIITQPTEVDESVKQALKTKINDCITLKGLIQIWTDNKNLQNKQWFVEMKDNRKEILIQNGVTE